LIYDNIYHDEKAQALHIIKIEVIRDTGTIVFYNQIKDISVFTPESNFAFPCYLGKGVLENVGKQLI
jgi:hypothetical protein